MKKTKSKGRLKWVLIYTAAFLAAFVGSALFKINSDPTHGKYTVQWSDAVGKVYTDLPYGDGAANKFDLYVPANNTKESYGLVVYLDAVKPISADRWVTRDTVPSVLCYGAHDKMQPFAASKPLVAALKENGVDYQYFVAEHSGHGLQNDNKTYMEYLDTVAEYLDKYMSK